MFNVYRAIDGCSINGKEFLVDDNGNLLKFDDYESAFENLTKYIPEQALELLLEDGIINITEVEE